MSVDRRFAYSLEAARLQASHRLEQAMHRVAAAQSLLQHSEEARSALLGEMSRVTALAMPVPNAQLEAHLIMARTAHLLRLRQRLAALEETIAARRSELEAAKGQVQARNIQLESFENNRAHELHQHLCALASRESAQADHDWLARKAWRQAFEVGHPASDRPQRRGDRLS